MNSMEVERILSVYDKNTEKLIEEHNLDHIDFNILTDVFNPPEHDPLMFDWYWIEEKEMEMLKEYIDLVFNFNKYIYQVECYQKGT